MKNQITTAVISHNEKLMIALPKSIIEKLELAEGDEVNFTVGTDVIITKNLDIDIPDELYAELKSLNQNDEMMLRWLNKKQAILLGKSPVETLKDPDGMEQVLSLINRLKRGDFS